MHTRTVITYALAATIVLILGAFSGWYFFLKSQSQANLSEDAARGYEAPSQTPGGGSQNPDTAALQGTGFFSRLLSTITGGGTGVSEPLSTVLTSDISGFTSAGVGPQTGTSTGGAVKRPSQLWHVHTKPVAGMSFVKNGGEEELRYVERSSGYIFDASIEKTLTTRLTNTLVPKIYEAFFTNDGHIIERSLNEAGNIVTIVGSISTTTKSATSSVQFSSITLPQNIERIVSDPKTGALFYLLRNASGVIGIRSEWNGAKPKTVFTSVIPHWQPEWLADGRIILTQAASDDAAGYAYELKSDGSLNPLIRSVAGLTTLGRSGGALLYGQSSGGALALFVQAQPTVAAIRLQIRTIAEKCVWAPGKDLIAYCAVPQGFTPRRFIDEWYRGSTHSSDALWRVNATTGSASIAFTPESGTSIDMENLTINSAGTHIAFMNATDKSLWLLRLSTE